MWGIPISWGAGGLPPGPVSRKGPTAGVVPDRVPWLASVSSPCDALAWAPIGGANQEALTPMRDYRRILSAIPRVNGKSPAKEGVLRMEVHGSCLSCTQHQRAHECAEDAGDDGSGGDRCRG